MTVFGALTDQRSSAMYKIPGKYANKDIKIDKRGSAYPIKKLGGGGDKKVVQKEL